VSRHVLDSHVDFDAVPGYKPIIGGLRHLTRYQGTPPAGMVVELLCGGLYQVARKKSPHVYDCSACAAVYCEEAQPSTSNGERSCGTSQCQETRSTQDLAECDPPAGFVLARASDELADGTIK
jgi:hypothetical protein